MMTDDAHDGDFASVVWDTPAEDPSSANAQRDGTQRGEGPSSGLARRASGTAGHSAAAGGARGAEQQQQIGIARSPSTERDAQNAGRYWIKLSAGEPTKMLENTKDAYVSYLVKGEVSLPVLKR